MNQEEIELKLLESIENNSSQRSLANQIGYSLGKVNYILKGLVEKGFVKAGNFAKSDNKSKYTYLLTEKGIKEKISLTEKFIACKKAEYDKLQQNLELYKKEHNSVLKEEGR